MEQAVRRRGHHSIGAKSVNLGVQALGIALAVGVWQLLSLYKGTFVLPGPLATFRHLRANLLHSSYLASHGLSSGVGYLSHLEYTVRNVLIGVGIGAAIGVGMGLLSMRLPFISEIATPLAATFGAAPIFVAAPFFLIWFGILPTAQVMIVTFYTSILMYVFSRRAGENLASQYVESALTLGGRPWSIFRWIYVPGTVPEIRGGFRIALAGSWGLAAIAELLGSQKGIGFLIKFYATAFVIDGMLALTVLLGIAAIVFDRLALLAFAYLTRWAESGGRSGL